ncbi:MAG TPA: phosphoribosylamine--glycine ligase [Candidatus Limnocylindria bacterium]|nr:phosphoribosylamine--glycine ligase [Candidatus Limnocylindria bacterium]
MRILVVGGGGREHALAWALARSPRTERVLCAPGNAGIAAVADCRPVAADDLAGLVRLARDERVELVVVGPELPLTKGLVDRLANAGIAAFGPSAAAARLEGSKVYTKDFLRRHGIPTAAYEAFHDPDAAERFVRALGAPLVVKADGLAAGKGVYVCQTVEEGLAAIDQVMRERIFGDAGGHVVVEEFLAGEEASFMAVTDGTTVLPLAPAQDHKRIFDDDRGPNTGGMGAYSPAPVVTPELHAHIMRDVMEPTVRALAAEGVVYRGVLYAGLMVRDGRAKVLEFNVRFGDPEAQAVLLRLCTDLVEIATRTAAGTLAGLEIAWDPRAAVCVVLAARGYPGPVEKGARISGLDALADWPNGMVFHAATRRTPEGLVTDGGRVLGVTALGDTIRAAIDEAYAAVAKISWDGMQYRRDVGRRALARG